MGMAPRLRQSFVKTSWRGVTPDGEHGGISYCDWPASALSSFVGLGSARQVWNLDGQAGNGSYDQIIVSVIADLRSEFPPSGKGTTETLQTFIGRHLQRLRVGPN